MSVSTHITVHEDPGHSWAEVPYAELKFLGIDKDITSFSYRKGTRCFLEEDVDVATYLKARTAAGHTAPNTYVSYEGQSFVRDLPRYYADEEGDRR